MHKQIRYLILLVGVVVLASCQPKENTEKATFYFVRHAEKDLTDSTANPPLTEAGEIRAKKLVAELDGVALDGIYSTNFQRNMSTVLPLSHEANLEIENYDWHNWQPMLNKIKLNKNNTYLICGHGDNLLPMIEYLGAKRPKEKLENNEYDNIFKVVVSDSATWCEAQKY